jgi:hypothetical protein
MSSDEWTIEYSALCESARHENEQHITCPRCAAPIVWPPWNITHTLNCACGAYLSEGSWWESRATFERGDKPVAHL